MTGDILLDWATLAISLFNAIILSWLGLTVLMTAERRNEWGIVMTSLALLMGGAFFISHTAILKLGVFAGGRGMILWWTGGLIPAVALPFAWYTVILWYSGYWGERPSRIHSRHQPFLWVAVLLLLAGTATVILGIFLLNVSVFDYVQLRLFIRWSIFGIPILAVGYSLYVIICIVLSLDALRRPGPTPRIMGDLARQRARPFLIGVSIGLLIVSLMAAGVILWLVQITRDKTFWEVYQQNLITIAGADFIISSLIAIANVMLGQAVVSYEVFTGKTLPRRGLWRHWRRVVMLAAGYGLLVGGSLAINLIPLYSLLLTTFLMTFFAALFSWRSYVEREWYIDHLRPFVSSQNLYDQLITPSMPSQVDIIQPFHALCANVLDAKVAYLAALGSLAPLVGPPLVYGRTNVNLPPLTEIIPDESRQTTIFPIDPELYSGAVWAVPLWSERGLIGVFLLSNKLDGGLYTQEEIEIARVSGERLIDTQASAEMSRRLMGLQRQQLAQTQVIDQRTRRTLHDDILPAIQASMITLSGGPMDNANVAEALEMMTDAHRQISDLLHEMPTTTAPEVARLGLVEALRRAVEDDFGHAFDEVEWQISPAASEKIPDIPSLTAEVVFYAAREAVRNAARYGRSPDNPFHLHLTIAWQDGLALSIEDNGVGITAVTQQQGSGQGLAIHSTMMAVVGGELSTDSVPNQYTRVTLSLPQ